MPSTCAASLAAALRSISLATLPERVTMPLLASMTTLLATLLSALIFFCTYDWTSESERPPSPEREQPTANNARETKVTQKYFLILIMCLLLSLVAVLSLDAELPPRTVSASKVLFIRDLPLNLRSPPIFYCSPFRW